MYRFWDTVIEPLLDAVSPQVIVEVGSDHGPNTERLLAFCVEKGGRLHVVDPLPKYDVSEWQRWYGEKVTFHLDLSLQALPRIEEGFDAVLIDGDHNWYTVFNELKQVEENSRRFSRPFPLVLLHDVGWPYGRRDLYYAPETIPPEHRQPHELGGMLPDSPMLLRRDGLNRHLHNAVREGGPHNGVLTAVEDFMQEAHEDLDLVQIPVIHGLGILVSARLRKGNERLARLLEDLAASVEPASVGARNLVLAERVRLDAEIRQQQEVAIRTQSEARSQQELQALQEELRGTRTETARMEKDLSRKDNRIGLLNERLRGEVSQIRQLMRWLEELDTQTSALLSSRQWQAGRLLGEVFRRATMRPRSASVSDGLRETLGKYRRWRNNSKEHRDAPFGKRPEKQPGKPAPEPPQDGEAAVASRAVKRAEQAMSAEDLAREVRRRLGPTPELDAWPPVSMVILNRNGLAHLKTLFSGLRDRTAYPNFEVVLVDNGSTDGSAEFARSFEGGFGVKVIENPHNKTFSEANNQGAKAASGELLLFLNNDTEAFDPGWLKELVHHLKGSGADAAGATLLYPAGSGAGASGHAVQHRAVRFRLRGGHALAHNIGDEDALGEHLGESTTCPAATAACLLMEPEAFRAVGGFSKGYRYGAEDVDLGLKLTGSGRRVVVAGRSLLLHKEFGTQDQEGKDFKRINRTTNRRLFLERWSPPLHRELAFDRLGNERFWSEEEAHVAITVTSNDPDDGYGDWHTGHEMGDALERRGWRVTYVQQKGGGWYDLPDDLDYLLVLLDRYDISRVSGVTTVAWIRNWTDRWTQHPWFGDYDVVLASSGISKEIVGNKTGKTVAAVFPIATNPERFRKTPPNPTYEADYVFTGNYWGENRLLSNLDVAPNETFLMFGKDWEKVPRANRYARGVLPYDRLPEVYSSAKLVVDHTASPTLPYGAVNSRVFDALGVGTLVVTNCEAGVRELFDGDFPTYNDHRDLRDRLDDLLGDGARREELARRYQEVVLREHTYDRRAEQLTALLRVRAESSSFCIKIGAPDRETARTWGDLPFARAMQRQLERRGHPCLVQTLDEWDNFQGLRYDVAIHLKGLTPYVPKPGQFNVLWNISHPDGLAPRECDRYDLVFVASERWAEKLRPQTRTPVVVLQQATDPEVFFPDGAPEHRRDLVFVGNSRKVERRILRDLLPTRYDLAVWGGDWEALIDARYLAGEFLPNDQVRKAYSSAAIVLNDHWDDMREHGFVSNRVYDVLACGALVLSDHLPEIEETFGDTVVTYRTPGELRELVDHYLASPEERAEKGRRGRELVLAKHTFGHRMEAMLREINRRMAETGRRTRILPGCKPAERVS